MPLYRFVLQSGDGRRGSHGGLFASGGGRAGVAGVQGGFGGMGGSRGYEVSVVCCVANAPVLSATLTVFCVFHGDQDDGWRRRAEAGGEAWAGMSGGAGGGTGASGGGTRGGERWVDGDDGKWGGARDGGSRVVVRGSRAVRNNMMLRDGRVDMAYATTMHIPRPIGMGPGGTYAKQGTCIWCGSKASHRCVGCASTFLSTGVMCHLTCFFVYHHCEVARRGHGETHQNMMIGRERADEYFPQG